MKEAAVQATDYEKAAQLKKELDKREAEKQKIVSLSKNLEEKVKAEDFEAAGKLRKELELLKKNSTLKDSLRKEIEVAVKKEKYEAIKDLKTEIRKLDGDLSNKEVENPSSPQTVTNAPPQNKEPAKKANSYIEKVKAIQERDPGFAFYVGDGFLANSSLTNFIAGIEFRLSRKNIFLRGLSIGLRGCVENILEDGDKKVGFDGGGTGSTAHLTDYTWYGYGGWGVAFTLKYYAPIPLKSLQPYAVVLGGGGSFYTYTSRWAYDPVDKRAEPLGSQLYRYFEPIIGTGIGCNFLLGRKFGAFAEVGYYKTSLVNLGLVLKL
jgi:hypothetical protein